ncbi:hypothetical protein GCM10027294_09860 [Marinactinospora endophytica]
MTTAKEPHRSRPHRMTLANGLTVILEPDPRIPRVGITVHYGVGFRSEPPGREGFAHLFEHLMFQGSESLPDGRFHDHVHRVGGVVNGTTHQDYTDYYQVVPSASLEQALFSEADRMRAPRFTPRNLAEQLTAVGEEIHQATVARPYGGFPWPLLPRAVYRSFPNAHDGYGDVDRLRRITVDDCADFFQTHYAPGNAVLTLSGGFDPEQAVVLVERHFGDIAPRPVPPAVDQAEPPLTETRWTFCSEPGVSGTALAIGHRLPDPGTDLEGYLAHLVLARVLTDRHRDASGRAAITTSCGFFGALDARDPDTMIISAALPGGLDPRRMVDAVHDQLRRWADEPDPGGADATRSLIAEHHTRYGDICERSRALGRLEILFGRAELLDELPDRIGRIGPEQVATAARSLAAAHPGVLAIRPGTQRLRPSVPAVPAATASRTSAEEVGRTPAGPRPLPPLGPVRTPRLDGLGDTTIGGVRVVALPDDRTPLAHIRLRLPLGRSGWTDPGGVDALLDLLRGRVRDGETPDRSVSLTTDGQWIDAACTAYRQELGPALAVLVAALSAEGTPLGPPSPSPAAPRSLERLADDLIRTRWAGRPEEGAGTRPDSIEALHRSITRTPGGLLVVVGGGTAETVFATARNALSPWPAPSPAATFPPPPPSGLFALPRPGSGIVHATLCAAEPTSGPGEAARYLATAVFGGYFRSRLAVRATRRGEAGYVASAGRDVLLDRSRAFVRATVAPELVDVLLNDVRLEARRLSEEPPDEIEVDAARSFCAAQMLSAFDSPSLTADVLRATVSAGRSPSWLAELPDVLRDVTVAEVAAAGRELFGPIPLEGVVAGEVDPARFPASVPEPSSVPAPQGVPLLR